MEYIPTILNSVVLLAQLNIIILEERRSNTSVEDAHAHIRDIARRVYRRSEKPQKCMNCGYDKHYEVCHIDAIESFALDTPMSVVNNIHNLAGLCPNCHWELDNGLLECKDEWR